jgi:hypothetical protein
MADKVYIRITRTVTLVDEIPFTHVYYPELTTLVKPGNPAAAVELELCRPLDDKLQEFCALLDGTHRDKVKFDEEITVIVQPTEN